MEGEWRMHIEGEHDGVITVNSKEEGSEATQGMTNYTNVKGQ